MVEEVGKMVDGMGSGWYIRSCANANVNKQTVPPYENGFSLSRAWITWRVLLSMASDTPYSAY